MQKSTRSTPPHQRSSSPDQRQRGSSAAFVMNSAPLLTAELWAVGCRDDIAEFAERVMEEYRVNM